MSRFADSAHDRANLASPTTARLGRRVWLAAALLAVATIAIYWPAMQCGFVNLDDQAYVTANVHVQKGLIWQSVKWAFLNPVSANWHPVTMLSHMLDCQVFGLKPWGHHLTNVLLHALNVALVLVWLQQMTGAFWRSLLVAMLFGWHPLHVESVAWIAERKDVLSGCFGLLTLIAYVRFVQRQDGHQPGPWSFLSAPFYWLSLFLFALGLMSKPMLVTWPCVLLLLDYWPLQRARPDDRPAAKIWRLLLEKIPFFALAALASVVAFTLQHQSGVVKTAADFSPGTRVGNMLISYCRYLGKMFWPTDLAVFYPYPGHWPLGEVLLAAGFLCGISIFCWVLGRRYPFLRMGWLWFLGTLVPVIGLVQVGTQSMADRYSYIPSLGVLILIVWGAGELARQRGFLKLVLVVASSTAIVLCVMATRQQLGYWKNSETLFRHTLAVTKDNYFAHKALGTVLLGKGETGEAARELNEAIRLNPADAEARNNLGILLLGRGRTEAALNQFQEAVNLKPNNAEAQYNLAGVLAGKGEIEAAIGHYQAVIRLQPDNAAAHNNLGIAFAGKNQLDEAISQFRESLRLQPNDPSVQSNLARALQLKADR